ncbi:MAG: hypothetical protein A2157_10780 [Deltaproteobacteria bacterium RBG_16_47_11]|nr:MAG: hypothetical protein A2157_10780 [Deltaproteobacteria bacterium RBG_16_47_11]
MEKSVIENLTTPTMEKIRESLVKKDKKKAIEMINELANETKKTNYLVTNWIWLLLTFIANNHGEGKVIEALTYKNRLQDPLCEEIVNAPDEKKIGSLASLMHAQFSEVAIEEDDAKFTIKLNPCGMAGRMRREGLDKESTNLRNTSKGYDWSWGKKEVSYYCAQCYLISNILKNSKSKLEKVVINCPTASDEPCHWYVYKTKNEKAKIR